MIITHNAMHCTDFITGCKSDEFKRSISCVWAFFLLSNISLRAKQAKQTNLLILKLSQCTKGFEHLLGAGLDRGIIHSPALRIILLQIAWLMSWQKLWNASTQLHQSVYLGGDENVDWPKDYWSGMETRGRMPSHSRLICQSAHLPF